MFGEKKSIDLEKDDPNMKSTYLEHIFNIAKPINTFNDLKNPAMNYYASS